MTIVALDYLNAFTKAMLPLLFATILSPTAGMWVPGTNIQRTMRLLAESTPAHPNRVKILFYGQSISKQDWWKSVVARLRARYPSADLVAENRAIGGFAADRLKRVVLHDVVPSYPDLIILHDYGGEPDYEELIRSIRSNVASEVLIQSDHVVWSPKEGEAQPAGERWHDAHVGWLAELATKYRMGFVDVRTAWRSHLEKNGIPARDLLVDGVHLNERGNALMADVVSSALVRDANLPEDRTLVRSFPASRTLLFQGNRVDIQTGEYPLEVKIDGVPPSAIDALYGIDRPSDCYAVDVPAVQRISPRRRLLDEEWTITLHDIAADVSAWKFRLTGSKTGFDGEGSSKDLFTSASQRIYIDPRDWYVAEAYRISEQRPPEGFAIRFRSWLRGARFVAPRSLTTVANGLPNAIHGLTLLGEMRGAKILIYRPPLTAAGMNRS